MSPFWVRQVLLVENSCLLYLERMLIRDERVIHNNLLLWEPDKSAELMLFVLADVSGSPPDQTVFPCKLVCVRPVQPFYLIWRRVLVGWLKKPHVLGSVGCWQGTHIKLSNYAQFMNQIWIFLYFFFLFLTSVVLECLWPSSNFLSCIPTCMSYSVLHVTQVLLLWMVVSLFVCSNWLKVYPNASTGIWSVFIDNSLMIMHQFDQLVKVCLWWFPQYLQRFKISCWLHFWGSHVRFFL